MIFIDANYFLRYLTQPKTTQDEINQRYAAALFERVASESATVTTSEAMLAEVAYILTSPQHYGTSRTTAATGLKAILQPRGFHMPAKAVSLRALDLWVAHPRLSFPDALAAAYSVLRGFELATFDGALRCTPGVRPYLID